MVELSKHTVKKDVVVKQPIKAKKPKADKFFIAVLGTRTLQVYNGTFIPTFEKAAEILETLQREGVQAHIFPFVDIENYIKQYEKALTDLEKRVNNEI